MGCRFIILVSMGILPKKREDDFLNSIARRLHFLSRFFSSPRKIGSITPSSRFLVNALLEAVPWYEINTIVELGAGTGVVTREIERRKFENCSAVIFEKDPYLRNQLKEENPERMICVDALKLREELTILETQRVECIVSSLPFANFTPDERYAMLQQIRSILSPHHPFIAYQYSLQMKPLLNGFFQYVDVHFVPFNLPPAFVYICR